MADLIYYVLGVGCCGWEGIFWGLVEEVEEGEGKGREGKGRRRLGYL